MEVLILWLLMAGGRVLAQEDYDFENLDDNIKACYANQ
jgi:hypothetical protein